MDAEGLVLSPGTRLHEWIRWEGRRTNRHLRKVIGSYRRVLSVRVESDT